MYSYFYNVERAKTSEILHTSKYNFINMSILKNVILCTFFSVVQQTASKKVNVIFK